MADLEKTVAILFKAQDEASATISTLSGNLSSFGGKLGSATQPLADLAAGVEKADAALAAMAIGGLAYAYNKAIGFESASKDLQKVLGDQKDRTQEAELAALDLSNAYGVSATSVLQSAANFKQAGFDYDESISLVNNSLDLMIAGDIAAAQASELIVSALKGFEAPASDAARYVDILNGVSNEYATNAEQLGIGLSKLSPIAKAMNFSFEETAGILTPVIEVFRSGSESADALKTGLLKLIDDSKPVRAALESIGVSQVDLNGNLRSGKDILYDVMKAFQGLAENDKLYITQQLVGIEQSARMVKVFDNLEKVTAVTATALGSAGSALEEVNLRLGSGMVAVDRFMFGFENLGITVGNEFRDAATSAVSGATAIESALAGAIKAGTFDEIFNAIEAFSARMGADLAQIAKELPEALKMLDFGQFMASLKDLSGAVGEVFSAMFGEVDLTTAQGLAAALQKAVDGITALVQVSRGIVEGLEPFARKLAEMASGALDADANTKVLTGNLLGLGQGVNSVISIFNNLAPALALLSGALVLDATAKIGALAAALATGPFAAAVAAAAALGAAFYYLSQSSQGLSEKLEGFDGIFGEFAEDAPVVAEALGAISRNMNDIPEIKRFVINTDTGESTEKLDGLKTSILSFPEDFTIEVTTSLDTTAIGAASALMNDLPREYTADFFIEADKDSIDRTTEAFRQVTNPDGTITWVSVDVDQKALKKTQDALKEIPSEKMLEIKLQGEIDKQLAVIKTGAETVQAAMEWQAKLDIADITGETERVKAMFATVSSTIDSVSSEIGALFSKVPKSEFDFGAREWKRALEQAMKIQQEGFDLEKSLIEAQISIMKKKESMMLAGKGLIKIDSTGLEPALEMIMWQILQKVQMRANEDSSNFLLGIG